MSLTVTTTPGKVFTPTERVDNAKLNLLGQPTFTVTGTMTGTEIAAGAVSAAKSTPDAYWYAAGTLTSNTYAVTLSPALAALTTGAEVWFKADVAYLDAAGTGICLVNVNGLGAVALKKFGTVDLAKNDVRAGQIVGMRYDGASWQMFSHRGNANVYYVTGGAGTDTYTGSANPVFTATAHLAGALIRYVVPNTNTGAATLNLNTTGAVGIKKYKDQALVAGDLKSGQVADLVYDGSTYQLQSPVGNPVIVAAISGAAKNLVLKAAAASGVDDDLSIAADGVVMGDGNGNFVAPTSVALTLNPTGSGANGFDSGAPTTTTWYYVWAIYNPTTGATAALGSASSTAPTMPSGYTYKGLLGEWYFETTTNPRGTVRYGDRKVFAFTSSGGLPALDVYVTGTAANVFAHRLGQVPRLVGVRLVCNSTDLNYAVNDEVDISGVIASASSSPFFHIYMDTTNVKVAATSALTAANTPRFTDKVTPATLGTAVAAKWNVKVIAET